MRRLLSMAVALACVAHGAMPAAARDLAVPSDKGWQHAETGLILPARLAGLSRTALTDATADEHDVAAQFALPDRSLEATLYLFHPAVRDVPLWFDRSRTAIETRDLFRDAAPASADPVAFAPPGGTTASGLRQVYASAGGAYRSTALAVIPVGGWIVAIRMSGRTLSADELDQRLQQVVAAIRWPMTTAAAPAAVPVEACASPLAFGKAKVMKADGADLLINLALAGTVSQKAKAEPAAGPPPVWCREGKGLTEYGIYRADGVAGYTMALYDAGRVISVFPSIMGQVDKTGTYSVTLKDVDDSASAFPSFSAMPSPRQVWELVKAGRTSGRVAGRTVTINAGALK